MKIDPTVSTEDADDTYISSSAPGTNYGTASQLVVGTAEIAYIKTPIIVIPMNAALDWAELRVYRLTRTIRTLQDSLTQSV